MFSTLVLLSDSALPAPESPLGYRKYNSAIESDTLDAVTHRVPEEWPLGIVLRYQGGFKPFNADSLFVAEFTVLVDYVEISLNCDQSILAPGQVLRAQASVRNVSTTTSLYNLGFGANIRRSDSTLFPDPSGSGYIEPVQTFSLAPGQTLTRTFDFSIPLDWNSKVNFLRTHISGPKGAVRLREEKFIVEAP